MGMIGNSLAQGLISGANIQDGTVDTPDIKDSAVTAAKIASAVVTPAKMDFSAGTANGVLYLNGSKVASSGSALTFDGTNLTLGANAFVVKNATGDSNGLRIYQAASDTSSIFNYYSGPIAFGTNNAEKMRLDASGNLVLGATSVRGTYKLDIRNDNSIALGGNATYFGTIGYNAGTGFLSLAAESGGGINFLSGSTERARIDSTGNFLVGLSSVITNGGSLKGKISSSGVIAQYGNDGSSVGSRQFVRQGISVNTTYTVRVTLGDSVYALADIRIAAYCGSGSGKANAYFSYGGHVGAYHMNTVFNSYSGNVTVGAPTISGNDIVITVTIANAGQNGMMMVSVDDVNATTGYISTISIS